MSKQETFWVDRLKATHESALINGIQTLKLAKEGGVKI